MEVYYARKTKDGRYQHLKRHLCDSATIAKSYSNFKAVSELIQKLHDIGKARKGFQNYLILGGKRGEIIHSYQAYLFIKEIASTKNTFIPALLRETVGMVISAHHNRLPDAVSLDGEAVFTDKIKKRDPEKDLEYGEVKDFVLSDKSFYNDVSGLFDKAEKEVEDELNKLTKVYTTKNSLFFAYGFFVKYLYSCLVDADRLDANFFDFGPSYKKSNIDWGKLVDFFEKKLAALNADTKKGIDKIRIDIDKIRADISTQCKSMADSEEGVYRLNVPTGGGKTLSSMRFALHHAAKHGKSRIIYVIPYLSVIEQTADVFRTYTEKRGGEIIFEHHSQVTLPDDETQSEYRKHTEERWDSPIIITTMVRFMETVTSSWAGELRRFHNIQNSVIIFDEIQSLPIKSINIFNETITYLNKFMNCTIVLCTATQPALELSERKNFPISASLIDEKNIDYTVFKRTRIVVCGEMSDAEAAEFAVSKADKNGACLIVVNTKKTARNLYSLIKNSGIEVLHLSTAMCAEHRRKTLEKIKQKIKGKVKFACVSTQLIEAGVDISFPCVIRAMAGLDSILQSAGRCNRSGEYGRIKDVYAIVFKNENLDMLADIKRGKEQTLRIIGENPKADLFDGKILEEYYKYYFADKNDEMNFYADGTTVYDMLSLNKAGCKSYENKNGKAIKSLLRQAFSSASDSYKLIADNTETVIAAYAESKDLLRRYSTEKNIAEKLKIIKALQKYGVSVYRGNEYNSLYLRGAIKTTEDEFGIKILEECFYDDDVGLLTEPAAEKMVP